MVVSTSTGSYWGELLATASRVRGARGIVGDCYARDTAALIEMRYPTFVAGALAYDSLGRIDVDGVGVPIECAGVTVHPGDLVIGDDDGVAIIPRGVAEEVIAARRGEGLEREPRCATGWPRACPWPRRSAPTACSEAATLLAIDDLRDFDAHLRVRSARGPRPPARRCSRAIA